MKNINIAIADDHPMVISGLINLLSPFRHIHVVGAYPNGSALLEGLIHNRPEVLLLDIILPDTSGKELVSTIKALYPDVKILIVTSLDAPSMLTSLMRRGANGYLLKGAGPQLIVDAIETVYQNREFIDAALNEQMLQNVMKYKSDAMRQKEGPELTQREKEIIRLIAQEFTTKEISEKLFISYRTAENHRYNLIQKLDVKNTAGLVKAAIHLGLV